MDPSQRPYPTRLQSLCPKGPFRCAKFSISQITFLEENILKETQAYGARSETWCAYSVRSSQACLHRQFWGPISLAQLAPSHRPFLPLLLAPTSKCGPPGTFFR